MRFVRLCYVMGMSAPHVVASWNVIEWLESTLFSNANTSPTIKTARSCSHISVEWLPLEAKTTKIHGYMMERRPDLNGNWKWTQVVDVKEDVGTEATPPFAWNDTSIDVSREYTYRLHLESDSGNSTFSYATVPVLPSCLEWSDFGWTVMYSLRFRADCVLPTVLRMAVFLGLLHLVMLAWRYYNNLMFNGPKKFKSVPLPPTPPVQRLSLRKQRSCSSTENESESDNHRLSDPITERLSFSSYRDSNVSERGSLASTTTRTCSACLKKFGMFRKRTVCTECSSTLCRGCSRANMGKCLCRQVHVE
ncbi:hypothetical protein AC1031_015734 [Aphanomyces cochlioides]|nr:hypothetical protein AC1031_015734 [Aphanomyces cochlioides]